MQTAAKVVVSPWAVVSMWPAPVGPGWNQISTIEKPYEWLEKAFVSDELYLVGVLSIVKIKTAGFMQCAVNLVTFVTWHVIFIEVFIWQVCLLWQVFQIKSSANFYQPWSSLVLNICSFSILMICLLTTFDIDIRRYANICPYIAKPHINNLKWQLQWNQNRHPILWLFVGALSELSNVVLFSHNPN